MANNTDDDLDKGIEDSNNDVSNKNIDTQKRADSLKSESADSKHQSEVDKIIQSLSQGISQMGGSLPSGMQDMLSQISGALGAAGSGASSTIAENAANIASKIYNSKNGTDSNLPVNGAELQFYLDEVRKVNLWLDIWTDFEPNRDAQVRVLRPSDWIDGSMREWIRYSEPFIDAFSASTVSQVKDATEQFPGLDGSNDSDIDSPKPKLGLNIPGVGTADMSFASIDAISDVIGALNKQALSELVASEVAKIAGLTFSGSDLGLDLFKNDYVFIPYNIDKFIEADEAPDNYRSYIVLREVAFTRFYHNVHWITGYIVSLIRKIVDGASFGLPDMMDMAASIESGVNPTQSMSELSNKRPQDLIIFDERHQEYILDLQTILALLESWVDYIAFRAGSVSLNNISQITVHHNRRRHELVSAEKIISSLIGIKVNHTLYNQAYEFWEKYFANNPSGRPLDEIWRHIDNLPKRVDKTTVQDFLNGWSGDDFSHDWDSLLN